MSETLLKKEELKEFIIKTVNEMTDRVVPTISEDEDLEIQKLHGKTLYVDDYDKHDCIRL